MPVVITTYEIAMRDRRALSKINFKYMVIDEGHRLKNSNCRLVRELKLIPAENKLLLTGMPHAVASHASTREHSCTCIPPLPPHSSSSFHRILWVGIVGLCLKTVGNFVWLLGIPCMITALRRAACIAMH